MKGPSRLHHHAYVSADLERTRAFYEDVIGLPLVATWTEEGNDATGGVDYCHVFFELGDGSALSFFQFADAEYTAANQPAAPSSAFDHVALAADADARDAIVGRSEAAGLVPFTINHGYCVSTYLADPDGLLIEITVDHPDIETSATERARDAHAELARWLGGDHHDNNPFRPDA